MPFGELNLKLINIYYYQKIYERVINLKKRYIVAIIALGEAGMFALGAVFFLGVSTWFLSGVLASLKLSFAYKAPVFIFVTGLIALSVFVLAVLIKAITASTRFIDVFDKDL